MGIHIPLRTICSGGMNMWWASLSQRTSWEGRAQRGHNLCSCIYLDWQAESTNPMPHSLIHSSDLFIHLQIHILIFPTCFTHDIFAHLWTHINTRVYTSNIPVRPIQALKAQWLGQPESYTHHVHSSEVGVPKGPGRKKDILRSQGIGNLVLGGLSLPQGLHSRA